MLKPELNAADRRVHDLHVQGFPLQRIAEMTGRSAEAVRSVIVGEWYEDKLAAKAAKQSRRG